MRAVPHRVRSRIASAGSCFAQHIARHLRQTGFNFLVTETAHPMVPAADAYPAYQPSDPTQVSDFCGSDGATWRLGPPDGRDAVGTDEIVLSDQRVMAGRLVDKRGRIWLRAFHRVTVAVAEFGFGMEAHNI